MRALPEPDPSLRVTTDIDGFRCNLLSGGPVGHWSPWNMAATAVLAGTFALMFVAPSGWTIMGLMIVGAVYAVRLSWRAETDVVVDATHVTFTGRFGTIRRSLLDVTRVHRNEFGAHHRLTIEAPGERTLQIDLSYYRDEAEWLVAALNQAVERAKRSADGSVDLQREMAQDVERLAERARGRVEE